MVAPIVGPTLIIEASTPQALLKRTVNKQAMPIDRVLGYERWATWSDHSSKPNNTRVDARAINPGSDYRASVLWNQALSRAYDKLRSYARGADASLGVALTELSQTSGMIGKRLAQVANFGLAVRRRDFSGAASVLGLEPGFKEQRKAKSLPPRTKTKAAKEFADTWLEYHFGWEPLVKDIYSGIEVLQQPFAPIWGRGSAACYFDWPYDVVTPGPSGSSTEVHERQRGQFRVQMGAKFSIANPNLFLANRLGLVNPAVIVYEAIPFSFVADWFFNVEQFLSQGTDFLGLSQSMAFTTYSWIAEVQKSTAYNPGTTGNPPSSNAGRGGGTWMRRDVGLASPNFTVRPLRLFGWERNLTAAALVTQLLKEGNPVTSTTRRYPRVYNWGDSFRP